MKTDEIIFYGGCPVFQIISLQNQIWDLEQLKQRGDNSTQLDKNILGNKAPILLNDWFVNDRSTVSNKYLTHWEWLRILSSTSPAGHAAHSAAGPERDAFYLSVILSASGVLLHVAKLNVGETSRSHFVEHTLLPVLRLMSVQTKIVMTQRLLEAHIEESRTKKTCEPLPLETPVWLLWSHLIHCGFFFCQFMIGCGHN